MKIKFLFFLLGLPLLGGCMYTAHLYPVRGPLSEQTPPSILRAKVTVVARPTNISVKLADGEVCNGGLHLVHQASLSIRPGPANTRDSDSLSAEWDIVYGPGHYVAHILGSPSLWRGLAQCNRGTNLAVEMYKPEDAPHDAGPDVLKGVAKDNKDNIYKLTF